MTEEILEPKISDTFTADANKVANFMKAHDCFSFFTTYPNVAGLLISIGYKEAPANEASASIGENKLAKKGSYLIGKDLSVTRA